MSTYGVGLDPATGLYYVVVNGTHYPFPFPTIALALAYIDRHKEGNR